MNKQMILRQTKVSSAQYQSIKNLKAFNADNYIWDSNSQLYNKIGN